MSMKIRQKNPQVVKGTCRQLLPSALLFPKFDSRLIRFQLTLKSRFPAILPQKNPELIATAPM